MSAAEQRFVRRLAGELLLLGRLPLGFLHGDAWSRNLMWSGHGAWIDFERARFGAVVQDLVPMYCGAWAEAPSLRTAVLGGYGRELSAEEEYALMCLAAVDAVSCLAWAYGHGGREAAARGRGTLDRLMAGVRA